MALPKKSSYLMGGTFNATPPVMIDGDTGPFQLDSSGNLKVTFTGGSASNPAAGPTGSAVPADASYTGVNVGGILQGVTGFSLNAGATIPAAVAIVDGSGNQITSFGGGTQYADNAASGATPTGTLSMGWDSTNSKVRALKVDASQNLEVVVNAALPAGTNVIGHVIVDSGAVAVTQSTNPWVVAGAKTPADSYTNPTDAEDAFALLGGWDATNTKWQRVQVDAGTGTLKVDPGTVTVTGTVNVGNFPATQPVSGTVTANQGTPNTAANSWPVEVTDGTNVLGTSSHPVRVDPTGTTTQPVSGSVSVSNFPATQNVAGTTTDGSTTETNFLVVGGESNDATAQYQPIPLGAGGRSVIIEGVVGGTAVPISGSVSVSNFPATQPVSGTVTANQGTANTLANAWPVEVTDGTNVLGTSAHPIRIDPTGTTTQPVSGTVGVTQSTSPWVDNITQVAGVNLLGQVAGSMPVTIVSGVGTIAGVPSTSVSVVDAQTVALVDLMQTLILETRAMRSALVYMVTENGDVRDSDFDPNSQDFQPVT